MTICGTWFNGRVFPGGRSGITGTFVGAIGDDAELKGEEATGAGESGRKRGTLSFSMLLDLVFVSCNRDQGVKVFVGKLVLDSDVGCAGKFGQFG